MRKEELARRRRIYNALVRRDRKYDREGNKIEFLLSYDEWWGIWAKSRRWSKRGTFTGGYVMARHDDLGSYEVGNVEIILSSENTRQSMKRMMQDEEMKLRLCKTFCALSREIRQASAAKGWATRKAREALALNTDQPTKRTTRRSK